METNPICSDFVPIVNFGTWLKNELKSRNIPVENFSAECGISRNSLWSYMREEHEPSLFAVCCIVSALGYELGVRRKNDNK